MNTSSKMQGTNTLIAPRSGMKCTPQSHTQTHTHPHTYTERFHITSNLCDLRFLEFCLKLIQSPGVKALHGTIELFSYTDSHISTPHA